MKLDFTDFLYALSYALDAVEKEVSGATREHGKRVAYISCLCAQGSGLSDEQMVDLAACAILHDNAVAEYISEELRVHEKKADDGQGEDGSREAADSQNEEGGQRKEDKYDELRTKFGSKSLHAFIGEKNIHKLPFYKDIENVILWHHENADGTGPFGKTEQETNLFSQIIHLADVLDLANDFPVMSQEEFDGVRRYVKSQAGAVFSHRAASLFMEHVTWERVEEMQEKGVLNMLKTLVPVIEKEYNDSQMIGLAEFFADIVDAKSPFTKDHSIGVAKKAEVMARHYGFGHEKTIRFAFAGALHDIGKMVVGNSILEKPDKLDAAEFGKMKDHAAETYKILHSIQGFEDITEWAANHHEKLDGTGYFRKLSKEQLSMEDRLMACIDIYQALTEKRPYKDGLSHRQSIEIMEKMAEEGKIDEMIVKDLDAVFGNHEEDQQAEEKESRSVKITVKKWKCSVCGYWYEGDTPPYSCPICDSDADQFELSE